MKYRSFVAAAALSFSAPAIASDWWIVLQRDSAGNVHFAETSQLRRTGDTVLYWTHIFYREAIGAMKSARIQFEVNCATFSQRERRYLDYDANRNVIESGDNTDPEGWREMAPDTSGALYIRFACAAPEHRRASFLRIGDGADIFEVAEFFLDPRPIVEIPSREAPRE